MRRRRGRPGGASIRWRRVDGSGRDEAAFWPLAEGWRLEGVAEFVEAEIPCRLHYLVECDRRWVTRRAEVEGRMGESRVEISIAAAAGGRWTLGGRPRPAVAGCLDVDLAFTPATNLLPLRRLELPVGGGATVPAAWLTFPGLTLERLDQRYARTGPTTYDYEAPASGFRTSLTVTPSGLVVRYPGLWEARSG